MSNEFENDFIYNEIELPIFFSHIDKDFLVEFAMINSGISIKFISREEFEEKYLEETDKTKQDFFLPEDIKLWELLNFIKNLDFDTFVRNTEKQTERTKRIEELGKNFEKAGLYIYEYLYVFHENNKTEENSKKIAEKMSLEFSKYGSLLQNKTKKNENKKKLSEEDKTKIDQWLLGQDVYQKRIKKLGKNSTSEQIEKEREKIISIYFKALNKKEYQSDEEKSYQIRKGPICILKENTKQKIQEIISIPKNEMISSIFDHGKEKLIT